MIEQFSQINVGVTFCYDFKMWLFTYLVIPLSLQAVAPA